MEWLWWVSWSAIIIMALMVLGWLIVRDRGRIQAFALELQKRESVPDDDLAARFFPTEEIPPDIPGRVRRQFAQYTGFPADKLLPNDDFKWFFDDLDQTALIEALEKEFSLVFSDEELTRTEPNIRAVSLLIGHKHSTCRGSHESR